MSSSSSKRMRQNTVYRAAAAPSTLQARTVWALTVPSIRIRVAMIPLVIEMAAGDVFVIWWCRVQNNQLITPLSDQNSPK
jgi:hypothetical protein